MIEINEVHFAACLLECGPHEHGRAHFEGKNLNGTASMHTPFDYYTRIWNWYINQSFPQAIEGHSAEWNRFTHDYFDWVESAQ